MKPLLTNQQLQVVSLVAGGHSNKEVARRLQLSDHTVAAYLSTAMLRMHAANRAGLVARCYHLGLLDVLRWPPELTAPSVRGAITAASSETVEREV